MIIEYICAMSLFAITAKINLVGLRGNQNFDYTPIRAILGLISNIFWYSMIVFGFLQFSWYLAIAIIFIPNFLLFSIIQRFFSLFVVVKVYVDLILIFLSTHLWYLYYIDNF